LAGQLRHGAGDHGRFRDGALRPVDLRPVPGRAAPSAAHPALPAVRRRLDEPALADRYTSGAAAAGPWARWGASSSPSFHPGPVTGWTSRACTASPHRSQTMNGLVRCPQPLWISSIGGASATPAHLSPHSISETRIGWSSRPLSVRRYS